MHYFNGYTFEEFEEKYGYKPYIYFEGKRLFKDNLKWYSKDRIDIDTIKIVKQNIENDGFIDGVDPFEPEDERFYKEQLEKEKKLEKHRENLRRNGLLK